jgi:hypothetical protein
MKIFSISILTIYIATIASEPCNDSLYVFLKQKSHTSLTQDESDYMNSAEANCKTYNDSVQAVKENQKNNGKKRTMLIVGISCAVAVTIAAIVFIVTYKPSGGLKDAGDTWAGN